MHCLFDSRLVVQNDITKNKYFLQVVSASIEHSSIIPTASIEVIANNGDVDYLSAISFDNLVWLETSMRYSDHEKVVWEKCFEGRIISQSEQWGNGSTATILCVGHAIETANKLILPQTPSGAAVTTEFPAGTDASRIVGAFGGLLTRTGFIVPESSFQTEYKAIPYQKYIKDVLEDLVYISAGSYFFETRTTYNAAQVVTSCLIHMRPVPTTPKTVIKSGTPKLFSAHFESDGGEVWNYIIQRGNTPEGGTQYQGIAQDATSITAYHARQKVDVDTSLNSNDLCQSLAAGKLAITKNPKITGTAEIILSPEIKWKDLVTVNIKQIRLNGSELNANLRVESVRHEIPHRGFPTTILEFGSLQKSTDDYLAEFYLKNRLTNSQFIS